MKSRNCRANLKRDADVLPVLVGDFMNIRVRTHLNAHLQRYGKRQTETRVRVETESLPRRRGVCAKRNAHTALQLLAMRLAVFLKVFSR